jgi:hypothetical protein
MHGVLNLGAADSDYSIVRCLLNLHRETHEPEEVYAESSHDIYSYQR